MPSTEQRIHGWILLGILTLLTSGVVCGLLWVILALSGDAVGAAAARIASLVSASLLAVGVVGQTAWISYSRIRAR